MGIRNELVQFTPPRRRLWTALLGVGLIASCEGVSRYPLSRGPQGMGGAIAAGAGGSTSSGSSNGGDSHPSEPGSTSGGGEDELPPSNRGKGGGPGEDVTAAGGNGGHAGGGGDDGSAGAGGRTFTRCSSKAPFGTPRRVLGLPDGAVRLRLNQAETVGYYARFPTAASYADLEVTKRARRDEAFSTGVSLNMNDSAWDFTPTLPADGSVVYFERRGKNLSWRIHQSVWDPAQQAFGLVDLVAGLGAGGNHGSDGAPYILPSGDVLYFHSDRFGMGLMRAERVGTSFARVKTVPITFPPGLIFTTSCPVVSPDELTIYFTVQDSAGLMDIWTATRANADGPFGEAAPMLEVNRAETNEVPSFISGDGCRLYFDRNSNVPFHWSPPGDSFVAEREPDIE